MMPDYGCFAIAWTGYGIVVPLIEHIFGIAPDAARKTVTFDPHLPRGWDDMSIEALPVGTTTISLTAARTSKGLEYTLESSAEDWTLVLETEATPGARYYLNDKPIVPGDSGIRMPGGRNRVLVVR
jgi:hypothetical protein